MWGNPETTPGGKALKFYSSVRIDVRRAAQLKKGEEIIGNRVKAKIVKNKVAPPFRTAEFDIYYNEGISYEADLLNTALKYELVKKSGASISYDSFKLGQGFDAAKNYLKENPKVREELVKKVRSAMSEKG
jgi:recombination protein RecA